MISGGSIAIDPEPNYGETPVISKEYAKLRKEFHQLSTTAATQNPNAPFYVIAESSSGATQKIHRVPGNFGTTRHFNGLSSRPSTKNPYYHKKENITHPDVYYATTNYRFHDTNYKRPIATRDQDETTISTKKGYENRRIPDYEDAGETSILKLMNSLLESHLGADDGTPTESSWGLDLLNSIFKETFDNETTTTTTPEKETAPSSIATTEGGGDSTISTLETESEATYESIYTDNTETTTEMLKQVTFKNVLNTTDCIENEIVGVEQRHSVTSTVGPVDANEINNLQEATNVDYASTETTSTDRDVTEVDLEFKVDVAKATPKPLSTIELLQNLTKMKEEGLDYDYNDLPPSLPNLR